MIQSVVRALLGAGIVVLVLAAAGCSKRVPLQDGQFEAQQKVVLTLEDGSEVRGKIGAGASVTYEDAQGVYRARVDEVSEQSITLTELTLIERKGSYREVSARMADARRVVAEPRDPVTVQRAQIQQVERVRFDTWQSVRRFAFWSYAGAVAALLLGERS